MPGAKKYLVYLMGTSKGLLLPAVILTYVMTGTLDFADNITHRRVSQRRPITSGSP